MEAETVATETPVVDPEAADGEVPAAEEEPGVAVD